MYAITRPAFAFALLIPTHGFAQGQGSWGGGTGFAQLVMVVLAVGGLLLIGVGYLVAGALGSRGMFRAILTVLIACAPLAYCSWRSKDYSDGARELVMVSRELREKAEIYIASQCALHSAIEPTILVKGTDGLFLSANGDRLPDIKNVPPSPSPTAKVLEQQKRYGYSYPPTTNIDQYQSILYWTRRIDARSALSQTGFAFVEHQDSGANSPHRTASLAWWRANTPQDELDRLLIPYRGGEFLTSESLLSFPVDRLRSTYRLELRDISTREDRSHWAARGLIQFSRNSDGKVLARYVGFAAAHNPLSPGYGYWWEKVTVCPGTAMNYLADDRWSPMKFFFSELVRVEGT